MLVETAIASASATALYSSRDCGPHLFLKAYRNVSWVLFLCGRPDYKGLPSDGAGCRVPWGAESCAHMDA